MSSLMSAIAGARTEPASGSGSDERGKGEEHKQLDLYASRAHLLQVEAEVRRIFDGLGSPVSNDADRVVAAQLKASLMFGEILFNGVSRILDSAHLHAASPGTRTLYDLGSGCGRLCVQAWLQFPNLERVVGVELTSMRSKVGFAALLRMGKNAPKGYESRTRLSILERPTPTYTLAVAPPASPRVSRSTAATPVAADAVTPAGVPRVLELRQGNLFDIHEAWEADILICETNIDVSMQSAFLHFLSHCKPGCRLLTYNSLEQMHGDVCARMGVSPASVGSVTGTSSSSGRGGSVEHKSGETRDEEPPPLPWKRLAINTFDDKFSASWGEVRFHLYTRTTPVAEVTHRPRGRVGSMSSTRSQDEHTSHSYASGFDASPLSEEDAF